MKKILILADFSEENQNAIRAAAQEAQLIFVPAAALTQPCVADADAVVGPLPQALIPAAQKLEYLQLCSAGADAYLAPGLLPEKITLCNATGAYGHAVSEHLFAGILATAKKLHLYRDAQHLHAWASLGGVPSIAGMTALIIGPGDIGGRLARLLHAVGVHILCVRRTTGEKPDFADEVYTAGALDSVLPRADIVAMAVPGSASTYHMISRAQFAVMKRGVILANAGRGNAIDPDALCQAVDSGIVGAAFLDVTEPEPLPKTHPLWDKKAVFITPHISGGFHMPQTQDTLAALVADNLRRYLSGQPLHNIVDRETGYRRK